MSLIISPLDVVSYKIPTVSADISAEDPDHPGATHYARDGMKRNKPGQCK